MATTSVAWRAAQHQRQRATRLMATRNRREERDERDRRLAVKLQCGNVVAVAIALENMAGYVRSGQPIDHAPLIHRLDGLAAIILESADVILTESLYERVRWH